MIENIYEKLYEKAVAENDAFVKTLQSSSPEMVIEQAYELVIREDFLSVIEMEELSPTQCKALLKEKKPMEKLFNAWQNHESRHMDDIRSCVENLTNELLRQKKEHHHGDCR